ncbi:response regulator transcription factor [uncultured Rikenella sp.]|uniref:response regulator transcription factor n=1 Tax=uncultured Rikenella sp. TaxID=368003 RepID=UPI002602DB88|nr:response regulator transcription factor [uncultured Rikenella sp.]
MNNTPRKHRKAVLIEPSAIIAAGLKTLLAEAGSEFEICGTFEEPTHFVERAPLLNPDLILIDPAVFDFQKRTAVHNFFEGQQGAALVAVVYSFIEPEVLKQYHGSIHIYDDGHKIIRKLRQAIDARQHETESAGENSSYELTERESEILVSVAKGMTNKEIADTHHISVHTVISHRKNITRKTGIKTVSGLTVYALLNNLIDQSEVE